MSRNQPCFCGSNLKQKRCHSDINETSQAANTLKIYRLIDDCLTKHFNEKESNPPCKLGCIECCYNFFSVSEIEFSIILYEMRKWKDNKIESVINKAQALWTQFKKENATVANNISTNINGSGEQMLFRDLNDMQKIAGRKYPCVFLAESTGQCMVYQVRPAVCRLFGTASTVSFEKTLEYRLCDKIPSSTEALRWQADLRDLEFEIFTLGSFVGPKNRVIYNRKYPLLYSVYFHFIERHKHLDILNFRECFQIDQNALYNLVSQIIARKSKF